MERLSPQEASFELVKVCSEIDERIFELSMEFSQLSLSVDQISKGKSLLQEYCRGTRSLTDYLLFSFDKMLVIPKLVRDRKQFPYMEWVRYWGFDVGKEKYGVFDQDEVKKQETKTLLKLPKTVSVCREKFIPENYANELMERWRLWVPDFESFYHEPYNCPDNIISISENEQELEMWGDLAYEINNMVL